MILLICFLIINLFTNDVVKANDNLINELSKQEDELFYQKYNFLNDSSDHLIWFLQVII